MKIRAQVLGNDGSVITGEEELLRQWQDKPEGRQQARHPPKIHAFDKNTFILFRGIIKLDEQLVLTPQQIGLFVGENYLVTIHREESLSVNRAWSEAEGTNDLLDSGSLALRIIDYASDRYLQKILAFEGHLGELEENLLSRPSDSIMTELVSYRSELRKLRRIFNYHNRLLEQILGDEPAYLGYTPIGFLSP